MNAAHERGEAKGEAMVEPRHLTCASSFRDHIFGCFIEDAAGLRLLDIIGEDNVMLETDYPHSDTTWPDSIGLAHKWLGRPARGRRSTRSPSATPAGSTTSRRPTRPRSSRRRPDA